MSSTGSTYGETFTHISATPQFIKFSPEELRVPYYRCAATGEMSAILGNLKRDEKLVEGDTKWSGREGPPAQFSDVENANAVLLEAKKTLLRLEMAQTRAQNMRLGLESLKLAGDRNPGTPIGSLRSLIEDTLNPEGLQVAAPARNPFRPLHSQVANPFLPRFGNPSGQYQSLGSTMAQRYDLLGNHQEGRTSLFAPSPIAIQPVVSRDTSHQASFTNIGSQHREAPNPQPNLPANRFFLFPIAGIIRLPSPGLVASDE